MTARRNAGSFRGLRVWLLFALLGGVCVPSVCGQEIQLGDRPSAVERRQHVELETDAATVRAGHPDWIELRFRVDSGLHINSHTPHDELLIPTTLNLNGSAPIRVIGEEYPAGLSLRLNIGSGETLSTYQGEFWIRLQVVVPKGSSVLDGTLRYQACDNESCFPPRQLPVKVALTTR